MQNYSPWRDELVMALGMMKEEMEKTATLEEVQSKLDARTFDRHWHTLLNTVKNKAEGQDHEHVAMKLQSVIENITLIEVISSLTLKDTLPFSRTTTLFDSTNPPTLKRLPNGGGSLIISVGDLKNSIESFKA